MATFKYEVCQDRKRKDGTYNVKIRITHNRQVKILATSIYVTKEDITKGFKIKNQQIIEELEKIIASYRSKCNMLSLYIKDMSMDDLVQVLTRDNSEKTDVEESIDILHIRLLETQNPGVIVTRSVPVQI